eukprot:scpid92268/ scgid2272/ 
MHGSFTRYGAKRKKLYTKRKKTKPLAKVEEFENGNVLQDKFGCVNSRNGVLGLRTVVFVLFSSCEECCRMECFQLLLDSDWCFHDNAARITNFADPSFPCRRAKSMQTKTNLDQLGLCTQKCDPEEVRDRKLAVRCINAARMPFEINNLGILVVSDVKC